jgi:putative FmdB family regulatory protein
MPLFEFICKKCNKKFEMLVFSSESVECPKCKSSEIVKQFSSFASMTSSISRSVADFCPSAPDREHKCLGSCCH